MGRYFASRGDAQTHYALFNGSTDGITYAIGAATRTGSVWGEAVGNPVITAGSSGTWNDDHVKDPCLLYSTGTYYCFASGYDGTKYQIGLWTAPSHEGPWTAYAGNPVLTVGSGGAIDDAGCAFPTVLHDPTDTGNEWKMWYRADDGTNQTVAYAHASAPTGTWTKEGMVINEGAGGTWSDEGVLPGAIIKEAGTYYLFVGGRKGTTNPQWQGGLYTFTDPEGTYTADAGNPIMDARHADANTSQVPTGDIAAGATTVGLTTPGAFNVGEAVALVDGAVAVGPEVFYLTAVGGATVTLDHATFGAFESTDGVFRSFAYNAVVPRSVIARPPGGYEAFVTPFQPIEDLTVPGSKLFEGSLEMRSSALTGAWTYYYVAGRGLLFPLVTGAAWHSRSAENPSVIAAP